MFDRLLLYLAMLFIGIYIGSKKMSGEKEYSVVQKAQTAALIILLFTMGIKVGADDKVISSMKTIGWNAFVITVFSIAASIGAVFASRKLLKIDNKGVKKYD